MTKDSARRVRWRLVIEDHPAGPCVIYSHVGIPSAAAVQVLRDRVSAVHKGATTIQVTADSDGTVRLAPAKGFTRPVPGLRYHQDWHAYDIISNRSPSHFFTLEDLEAHRRHMQRKYSRLRDELRTMARLVGSFENDD